MRTNRIECIAVCILLAYVAHAHTEDFKTNDHLDKLVASGINNLQNRALAHQANFARDADLDQTVLGKAGHLAAHTSPLSIRSSIPSSSFHALRPAPSFPLAGQLQPAPNDIASQRRSLQRKQLANSLGQTGAYEMNILRKQQQMQLAGALTGADQAAAAVAFRDLQTGNLRNNLGELGRLWLGQGDTPAAMYKFQDFGELFGGALFLVLKRFQEQYGSVFLLPTGPTTSFLVLSDPASAQHVLDSYATYEKGLVREISQFLFGDGFVVADGTPWRIRRRAITPSFHKKYLDTMVQKVFADCSLRTAEVLGAQPPGHVVNMEKVFSELTLDIIGKAVFNYDFKSIFEKGDNPVIEAVYTALKEVEARSLDFTPIWKLPGDLPTKLSARQKRVADAVATIRKTTEDLVENCRVQMESEEAAGTAAEFQKDDYMSEADPSIMRFLIASKEEVISSQLRDDLLSMLVAGHETTASVLTWTMYLLAKAPEKMARVQKEIDDHLGAKITAGNLTLNDLLDVNYLRWCIWESMRLYPHPPVLIRRALKDDVLPNGMQVPEGQDVMISVYNIHHSSSVWTNPEEFEPERWSQYNRPRDTPNERNTNYEYIPFSGGARRCVGDQFALLESYTAMAALLYKFDFKLVPGQDISMTTGATIHTTNGMMMTYAPRIPGQPVPKETVAAHEPLDDQMIDTGAGCPFSRVFGGTDKTKAAVTAPSR